MLSPPADQEALGKQDMKRNSEFQLPGWVLEVCPSCIQRPLAKTGWIIGCRRKETVKIRVEINKTENRKIRYKINRAKKMIL